MTMPGPASLEQYPDDKVFRRLRRPRENHPFAVA